MLPRKDGVFMTLAAIIGVLIVNEVNAVDVESHNIPSHLLDCYQNESLYHRENRIPSTLSNVVSILRQIEESPNFIMDMRSFALSLLHMFRVDGVERDPEVVASEHTIPFGLTGTQYYKYHLLMNGLIPRTSFLFPNETLTDKEKCSLHFMMSNSLDKIRRGDEHLTCQAAQYRAAASSRRQRRSINDADGEVESVPVDDENSAGPVTDDQESSDPQVMSGPSADNAEAELLELNNSKEQPALEERKGDLIWNKDGEGPPSIGKIRNAVPAGAPARLENPSDCPVENGVIYARWGSVQLGTVLAGIATGFETQRVQLKDLRKTAASKFMNPKISGSLEIDNRYAATLAGDLAEVALWRGPKGDISIGASGGWNSTQSPRWYFIKGENEMTDAEMRGGLDGLIMAHHVKEWYNKANSYLKLSSLLERYYSARGIFDEDYKACERQKYYKEVAASATLEPQTTNFGYLLYDTTPRMPTITVEGVADYASQALDVLDRTIPTHMEGTCETLGRMSDDDESIAKVNMKFIVDCSYAYDVVYETLSSLAQELELHPLRSSITVYGGMNFEELFQKSERNHLFVNNLQTNRPEYESCSKGMDLKNLLGTHLYDLYSNELEEEKENKTASVQSQIVVIMPNVNYDLSVEVVRDVENLIEDYRRKFPDVTFIIFAQTKKENFKVLVEDYEKDVIAYNNVNDIEVELLVSRLNQEHRRISNPVCGNEWKTNDYGSLSVYDYVSNKKIAYYRIHQKYLFGAGKVTIKVQEGNTGTIRVCHSRKIQYPSDDESSESDVDCEELSNNEHQIQIDKPCGNSKHFLSCNPVYISIEPVESRINCKVFAGQLCPDVDDISISITHSGLTCGAATALATPLLCAMAIVTLLKTLLSI